MVGARIRRRRFWVRGGIRQSSDCDDDDDGYNDDDEDCNDDVNEKVEGIRRGRRRREAAIGGVRSGHP